MRKNRMQMPNPQRVSFWPLIVNLHRQSPTITTTSCLLPFSLPPPLTHILQISSLILDPLCPRSSILFPPSAPVLSCPVTPPSPSSSNLDQSLPSNTLLFHRFTVPLRLLSSFPFQSPHLSPLLSTSKFHSSFPNILVHVSWDSVAI